MGFVVRGSDGQFVCAGSKTIWGEGSAEMVEAKAILWALSKAKEFEWCNIVVESDCKLVVDALSGIGRRIGHVQTVLDNCLLYGSDFSLLSFSFCFRDVNGVAHRLAKWAACGLSDDIWHVAPNWIGDALYFDLNQFKA
ncbi:unnamed protein product [Amaranthus hypochondriacus]